MESDIYGLFAFLQFYVITELPEESAGNGRMESILIILYLLGRNIMTENINKPLAVCVEIWAGPWKQC